MGSVYNRGTKHKPNWWMKYRELDGKISRKPSNQPTKQQAREVLAAIEARVGAGKVGLERPEDSPLCGELMDKWEPTLKNRSADDDRSRLKKHVRPVFA